MKFKAIIYQNKPKRIHDSLEKINWFGLQQHYVFEERNKTFVDSC